jgi:hypothetical protein
MNEINSYRILIAKPEKKSRGRLGDVDEEGRTVLYRNFDRRDMKVWEVFIWLRTRISSGRQCNNEILESVKGRGLLDRSFPRAKPLIVFR